MRLAALVDICLFSAALAVASAQDAPLEKVIVSYQTELSAVAHSSKSIISSVFTHFGHWICTVLGSLPFVPAHFDGSLGCYCGCIT